MNNEVLPVSKAVLMKARYREAETEDDGEDVVCSLCGNLLYLDRSDTGPGGWLDHGFGHMMGASEQCPDGNDHIAVVAT